MVNPRRRYGEIDEMKGPSSVGHGNGRERNIRIKSTSEEND